MPGPQRKLDYAHDKLEKTSGILQNPMRIFQIPRRIRVFFPKTEEVHFDFDHTSYRSDRANGYSDL